MNRGKAHRGGPLADRLLFLRRLEVVKRLASYEICEVLASPAVCIVREVLLRSCSFFLCHALYLIIFSVCLPVCLNLCPSVCLSLLPLFREGKREGQREAPSRPLPGITPVRN